jgi:hypothetical protein
MLRVGERTGMMGDMMERAATFHEDELQRWVERFTRKYGVKTSDTAKKASEAAKKAAPQA